MHLPVMAFINKSTVISDHQLMVIIGACQTQVTRDFAPFWGKQAHLQLMNSSELRTGNHAYVMYIYDEPFEKEDIAAGALGYHTVNEYGAPVGEVFAKLDIDNGLSVSCTISHEVLEMLADSSCDLCAQGFDDDRNEVLYSLEVCDPVEADEDGYHVSAVLVSNFALPAWFNAAKRNKPGVHYDFLMQTHAPFQIRDGGYISVKYHNQDWKDISGPNARRHRVKKQFRPTHTRTARRNAQLADARCEWQPDQQQLLL